MKQTPMWTCKITIISRPSLISQLNKTVGDLNIKYNTQCHYITFSDKKRFLGLYTRDQLCVKHNPLPILPGGALTLYSVKNVISCEPPKFNLFAICFLALLNPRTYLRQEVSAPNFQQKGAVSVIFRWGEIYRTSQAE